MTYSDELHEIAATARMCWTCGGTPNPANFGGLCDPCYAEHQQRLARAAEILRQHAQSDTETGRALAYLGY